MPPPARKACEKNSSKEMRSSGLRLGFSRVVSQGAKGQIWLRFTLPRGNGRFHCSKSLE